MSRLSSYIMDGDLQGIFSCRARQLKESRRAILNTARLIKHPNYMGLIKAPLTQSSPLGLLEEHFHLFEADLFCRDR